MKHLINREDYIKEYLHINRSIENIIEREIENNNELDEGLLSTLFGGLKMLLKKDWENIKCKNPSVLSYLKDIDKSLSGYTMTKMQYSNECNNIRQNIADYFNDILDYKLLQLEKEDNADKFIEKENKAEEENTEVNGVAKYLNLKDKTLLDSLKKYKENISTACKSSPKLKEYADQMLNSVVVFVNDIIIKELEKMGANKEKLEKKKKKLEEEERKLEELRNKMNEEARKAGEKALKKLADERDKALRNIDVKPIGPQAGDKTIDDITKQFSDIVSELNSSKNIKDKNTIDDIFNNDTYVGIKKAIDDLNLDFNDVKNGFLLKVIVNKINTVFEYISKNSKKQFSEVPSTSVQSMMVSLSNTVIYGFKGDEFDINKDRLSLLSKCAIDSDATIGFNLPLIDPSKPDNGNLFVGIMNKFKSDTVSSKEFEKIIEDTDIKELKKIAKAEGIKMKEKSDFVKEYVPKVMKDFKQNITNLFDKILQEAKRLKAKAEKERAKAEKTSSNNS